MEKSGVTREQMLNERAFDRWQSFCHSDRGLWLMFVWAAAEAIFWPIVPDGLLVPMAMGGRSRYWKLLGICALGSAMGGIAMYLFAYFAPGTARAILPHLPVVQGFMIDGARAALDQRGWLAFWDQPWSGISYKVFAVEGGARGLNPAAVLPLAIFARAVRMLSTSAVPALAAWRFPKFMRDYWIYVVLIYLLLFGYVWVKTQLIGL